jgi:inorganic pyrophosphatase
LSDTGYYCLFATRASSQQPVQTFHKTIPQLVDAAMQRAGEGCDVYFALATFVDPKGRKADNVEALRSLFVDLDCGVGKPFVDQPHAVTALRAFCKQHKLPKPIVVNSGRGIHAYWPLEDALPRREWQPLADGFRELCLSNGFAIDPVVTADSARVLRVPGSENMKDGTPRPVRVVVPGGQLLSVARVRELVPVIKTPVPAAISLPSDPLMDALLGNMTSRFRTIMQKCAKGTGCSQLTFAATHQDEVDEPLWRAALSIAAHCVDADKAIHKISEKHPNYNPAETAEKAQLTKGPYHCSSFATLNAERCEGCPHKGRITSPIQLGKEVIEAEPEDNVVTVKEPTKRAQWEDAESVTLEVPQYPAPYFRGKNGGVYLRTQDKAGDPMDVCVYRNDMYVVNRINDEDVGDAIIVRVHMPRDGVREITVPTTTVATKEELRKIMAKHGVLEPKVDLIMDYLIKWTTKMEYTTSAAFTHRQFGWTDDTFTGFALGDKVYTVKGTVANPPAPTTVKLFPIFVPKGTLQDWKDTVNFYNRPDFEAHQYIVGTGFGSVLTRLTPIRGSLFHFHSKDSGLGKTSAMWAGASVWADPDQYVLIEQDTNNSKMLRAEVYKDLPLYLDEMTNVKPNEASDIIYQIPSGMQRNRMAGSMNVERTRGKPWALIAVTTGNTSLLERISEYKAVPKAEAQRVIEVTAHRMLFKNKHETDVFSRALKANYGHAGPIFLAYVMEHVEDVQAAVAAIQQDIDEAAGLTAENRHWSVQAACVLTALKIAKHLGLVSYDLEALQAWIIRALIQERKRINDDDLSAPDLLMEYLNATYSNFLRLRSTDDRRRHDASIVDAVPRGDIRGRHETDTNMWYILPTPLKNWCVSRQINYGWLVKEMQRAPANGTLVRCRLGKGTKIDMPPTLALKVSGEGWFTPEMQKPLDAAAGEVADS